MFIGKYDKSVVVTFLGTLSAMIGMYFILGYDLLNYCWYMWYVWW